MTPTPDDRSLYRRWLGRRDRDAFEALARRHGDLAMDVSYRISGDLATAEDAVQEALLRLATDGTERPVEVGVRAWLARIAVCSARNARASDRARSRRERTVGAARKEVAVAHVDPEVREEVEAALSRLEPDDRMVLVLRYLHGLEYGEIAHVLEVAEPTARVRVHRALESARRHTKARGDGAITGALGVLPVLRLDATTLSRILELVPKLPPVAPGLLRRTTAALLTPAGAVLLVAGFAVGVWVGVSSRDAVGVRPEPKPVEVATAVEGTSRAALPEAVGPTPPEPRPPPPGSASGQSVRVPQRPLAPKRPRLSMRILRTDATAPVSYVAVGGIKTVFDPPEVAPELPPGATGTIVVGTASPLVGVTEVTVDVPVDGTADVVASVPGAGDSRLSELRIVPAVERRHVLRPVPDGVLEVTEESPGRAPVLADDDDSIPLSPELRRDLSDAPGVLLAPHMKPRLIDGPVPNGLPSASWEAWDRDRVLPVPMAREPATWRAVSLRFEAFDRSAAARMLVITRVTDDPSLRRPFRTSASGHATVALPPDFALDVFVRGCLVATIPVHADPLLRGDTVVRLPRVREVQLEILGLTANHVSAARTVLLGLEPSIGGDAASGTTPGQAALDRPEVRNGKLGLSLPAESSVDLLLWTAEPKPEGRRLQLPPDLVGEVRRRWVDLDVLPTPDR